MIAHASVCKSTQPTSDCCTGIAMLQKLSAALQRQSDVLFCSKHTLYSCSLLPTVSCLHGHFVLENMLQCPFMATTTAREAATCARRQKLLVAATCRYNAHVVCIQAQTRTVDDSALSLLMLMSWMASDNVHADACQGLAHLLPPP